MRKWWARAEWCGEVRGRIAPSSSISSILQLFPVTLQSIDLFILSAVRLLVSFLLVPTDRVTVLSGRLASPISEASLRD